MAHLNSLASGSKTTTQTFISSRLSVCLKLLELTVPSHKLVGEVSSESVVTDHCDGGQEAVLECNFDMEEDNLYSVKWYRNEQEFYRLATSHFFLKWKRR